MSQETVHVQCVIVRVRTQSREYARQLTDYRRLTSEDRDVARILRQGPLEPGGYLFLGNFEEIILKSEIATVYEAGSSETASDLSEVENIEICAAAVHGPTENPIGARRLFSVEPDEEHFLIRPWNIHTEQLVRWRKRSQVRRWVEQCLHPQQRGGSQTQQSEQTGK